jgi:hypothetical protein
MFTNIPGVIQLEIRSYIRNNQAQVYLLLHDDESHLGSPVVQVGSLVRISGTSGKLQPHVDTTCRQEKAFQSEGL